MDVCEARGADQEGEVERAEGVEQAEIGIWRREGGGREHGCEMREQICSSYWCVDWEGGYW